MGLLPDQFYAMTWTDYSRAAQGYWLRNARYMEGVRRGAYFTVLMNSDPKKAKQVKENSLFRIATDPVVHRQPLQPLSKEEYDAIIKRYKLN